jgi:hypothetical protein
MPGARRLYYTMSLGFVKRKIWRIFRGVSKYGSGKGLWGKIFFENFSRLGREEI